MSELITDLPKEVLEGASKTKKDEEEKAAEEAKLETLREIRRNWNSSFLKLEGKSPELVKEVATEALVGVYHSGYLAFDDFLSKYKEKFDLSDEDVKVAAQAYVLSEDSYGSRNLETVLDMASKFNIQVSDEGIRKKVQETLDEQLDRGLHWAGISYLTVLKSVERYGLNKEDITERVLEQRDFLDIRNEEVRSEVFAFLGMSDADVYEYYYDDIIKALKGSHYDSRDFINLLASFTNPEIYLGDQEFLFLIEGLVTDATQGIRRRAVHKVSEEDYPKAAFEEFQALVESLKIPDELAQKLALEVVFKNEIERYGADYDTSKRIAEEFSLKEEDLHDLLRDKIVGNLFTPKALEKLTGAFEITSAEVRAVAKDYLTSIMATDGEEKLSRTKASELLERFPELATDPEIVESGNQLVEAYLKNLKETYTGGYFRTSMDNKTGEMMEDPTDFDRMIFLIEELNLNRSELRQDALEVISHFFKPQESWGLSHHNAKRLFPLMDLFEFTAEELGTANNKERVFEYFNELIKSNYGLRGAQEDLLELTKRFGVSGEDIFLGLKSDFLELFEDNANKFLYLCELFNISNELYNTELYKKAASKKIEALLQTDRYAVVGLDKLELVQKILNKIPLHFEKDFEEELNLTKWSRIFNDSNRATVESMERYIMIAEALGASKEQVQEIIFEGLAALLREGSLRVESNIEIILWLRERFREYPIENKVIELTHHFFGEGADATTVLKGLMIFEKLDFDPSIFQDDFKESLLSVLDRGDLKISETLLALLEDEDFLETEEFKKARMSGLFAYLKPDYYTINDEVIESIKGFAKKTKLDLQMFREEEGKMLHLFHSILHQRKFEYLEEIVREFKLPKKLTDQLIGEVIVELTTEGSVELASTIMQETGVVVKELERALDIFGLFLTKDSYKLVGGLLAGEIPEAAREIGITQPGEAGYNQLREIISKFKSEIITNEEQAMVRLEQTVFRQILMGAVRFETSEWGNHGQKFFDEVIKNHEYYKEEGYIDPLAPEYQAGSPIRIPLVDKERQRGFQFSEPFRARYKVLRESIERCEQLRHEKKPLSRLAESITAKKEAVLNGLRVKIAETESPRAKEGLAKKIEQLESINPRSVEDFQKNFEILSKYGEFKEELMDFVFYMTLHKHPTQRERIRKTSSSESPQFDDIPVLLDFVEHIVNQETMSEYFTDINAMKAFRGLINMRSFEEELERAQKQDTVGTIPIQFVPSRGLLMEFSGYIADACWASKYKSIAQRFPNVSSVIIVQSPENKNIRLAGAAMLIECEAEDGTPLLVVRGLNPIENLINQVSVEAFYNDFTSYVREQAERMGRKVAIVLSPSSGMASTNRPVLLQFLQKELADKPRVNLSSSFETEFNGYHIATSISGNTVHLL